MCIESGSKRSRLHTLHNLWISCTRSEPDMALSSRVCSLNQQMREERCGESSLIHEVDELPNSRLSKPEEGGNPWEYFRRLRTHARRHRCGPIVAHAQMCTQPVCGGTRAGETRGCAIPFFECLRSALAFIEGITTKLSSSIASISFRALD